ncbi:aldehyde ferredoxin oxidoreductase family protein [Desulfovibrio litoralis]|uniref:Aldehyde:ferredoxin oxidoreductase n=1 Tax=Desulfovibrio litoralis DSM 11393 TaxID=1121455 RepID=A0A1M7T3V6_9BACT|nr:aldehyde ferredoxin oxidoreductase family protein [Desulfovibrio litoralis]SHN65391.1 aldehyde:ferredoxin oxidoreductase [Desulfovibrio litoralis DSM 11393]
MAFGYNGKILHVDLSKGECTVETPDEVFYRTYWGGGALASYYLLKFIPKGADALGPDNVLVFATSVLCGAPLSGFSRFTVAAKNPLTNGFGESEAGGYFGPELKHAGYDAVVFRGKSAKPVYLWIKDGKAELRDASKVWGKENAQCQDMIREELSEPKARVASIGPAGEKQVLFACIMNELAHANGRCGMGAVMGSKNLKAVVCLGNEESIEYADAEALKEVGSWHRKAIAAHMPNVNLGKFGTPMHVMAQQNAGILPTRNWKEGVFEHAEAIGLPGYEKILKKRHTCYKCSVACKRVVTCVSDERYGGPEYETLAALGSLCGVGDLEAVCKGHERCNALGLDTVGTGAVVAFAMEMMEKGITKLSDGRTIKFGDKNGMVELVEMIANRKDLGDILALGIQRAGKKIGNGAEELNFTVKGQEPAFHDPRGKTGVGMGFALSPTGADHIEAPHEVAFQGDAVKMIKPLGILEPPKPLSNDAEKVRYFIYGQQTWAMNNTLSICNFVVAPIFAMSYAKLCEAVQAITGWETSLFELMKAAERSIVLARMFNAREGLDRKDDKLFKRLYEALPAGPSAGKKIDEAEFRKALDLYYDMVGWDENGIPRKGTLHQLNLGFLAE